MILPCLVTPALFLGPLYARYLGSELPFMANWSVQTYVVDIFCNWIGFRNYVVVGPF